MQLTLRRVRRCAWLAAAFAVLPAARAHAQAGGPPLSIGAGTTAFHEYGGPLHMTVITPEVNAQVQPSQGLAVHAEWNADIVSGASVAVVDAPAASVDAISGASVHDVRHVLGGGLRVFDGQSTLSAGYHYATENDYRSNAIDVGARTELFEHDTALEIAYSRGFDEVCDGPGASDPALKARLDTSQGCFNDKAIDRRERDLSIQTFQGAWTQHLTPILSMQATATAQLLDGFQSNPYRAVRIGRGAAQEHEPNNRARYAAALGFRIWIKPLAGALQPLVRAYRDTWDIRSLAFELAYEQSLFAGLRFRARARLYTQTSAAFYSDDYVLEPRGQYFTGDRELSRMTSGLYGGQFAWSVPPNAQGDVIGFLSGLQFVLRADLLKSSFPDFHYDRAPVPNTTALIGTFSVLAGF
jgi:hypothetical protein